MCSHKLCSAGGGVGVDKLWGLDKLCSTGGGVDLVKDLHIALTLKQA
jgi:hypothetical protein